MGRAWPKTHSFLNGCRRSLRTTASSEIDVVINVDVVGVCYDAIRSLCERSLRDAAFATSQTALHITSLGHNIRFAIYDHLLCTFSFTTLHDLQLRTEWLGQNGESKMWKGTVTVSCSNSPFIILQMAFLPFYYATLSPCGDISLRYRVMDVFLLASLRILFSDSKIWILHQGGIQA